MGNSAPTSEGGGEWLPISPAIFDAEFIVRDPINCAWCGALTALTAGTALAAACVAESPDERLLAGWTIYLRQGLWALHACVGYEDSVGARFREIHCGEPRNLSSSKVPFWAPSYVEGVHRWGIPALGLLLGREKDFGAEIALSREVISDLYWANFLVETLWERAIDPELTAAGLENEWTALGLNKPSGQTVAHGSAPALFLGDVSNPNLRDLIAKLDAELPTGKSKMAIAREFFNGDSKKAKSANSSVDRLIRDGVIRKPGSGSAEAL